MRVGRMQAFALRYPEPNNDGQVRSLTLVRVETDGGLVGWGEAVTDASGGVAGRRVPGRAPPGPSTRREGPPGRCRDLAPAPGGDLLGREWRPPDLRHQRRRHSTLGPRLPGRWGAPLPAAGGPPPGAAAHLCLGHLRDQQPGPNRPGVPGLRRPGLSLRQGRLGPRPRNRLRPRRAAGPGHRQHRAGRLGRRRR